MLPPPNQLSASQIVRQNFNRLRLHLGPSSQCRGAGLGEVPSRDPYLLQRFSKPATILSWRARVA